MSDPTLVQNPALRPFPFEELQEVEVHEVKEKQEEVERTVSFVFDIRNGHLETEDGHVKISIVDGKCVMTADKTKKFTIANGSMKKKKAKEVEDDSDLEDEDDKRTPPSCCKRLCLLTAYAVPTFALNYFNFPILSNNFAKLMGTVAKTSLRPFSWKWQVGILGSALGAAAVIDQFSPYPLATITVAGTIAVSVYERYNKLYILGKKKP